MIALVSRPRLLFASVAVHATAIGCAIAWFGFAAGSARLSPTVKLDLAQERETALVEERMVVPVDDPVPLEDRMFKEIDVPVCPPEVVEPEHPEPTDFHEEEAEVQHPEPSPRDWLVVVRRKQPERDPTPVAPAVEVRTRVAPTPIAGQNSAPRYPSRAARLGIQGTVTLAVVVDAEGRVISCRVATTSGSRLLDGAALRAVRDWRFRNGPGTVLVPVVFTLERGVR